MAYTQKTNDKFDKVLKILDSGRCIVLLILTRKKTKISSVHYHEM